MQRRTLLVLLTVALSAAATAQQQKEIYIPRDLAGNDFTNDSSQWSYGRMACTDNVVVFWEKGFGPDLAAAPPLEGHDMRVDLPNLLSKLERFYVYFRDTLHFTLPGSKSERWRMLVMLNYSLEGTAYGGDYDLEIGALWIAPNRVQDDKLNCIAHELGHSFQLQIICDDYPFGEGPYFTEEEREGPGEGQGAHLEGGFYEMASQWMLWQVNPEWVADENYHWQAFRGQFHRRLLSLENIYRSPYVLEYWGQRRGLSVIADLLRDGKRGEDAVSAYMRTFALDEEQMAAELWDCYARLLTFDYDRVRDVCRPHALQLETPTEAEGKWLRPQLTPETYGWNVIALPKGAKRVTIAGLGDESSDAFYYGVVWVDEDLQATYQPAGSGYKGNVRLGTPPTESARAFLVVVPYPKDGYQPLLPHMGPSNPGREETPERTYPYQIRIK